ncbi:MAG TPA: tripartite tricarboxylate transporter permease [Thermodesulfobacteriota bacterium]|nr:tripartite tricarboxylate transporter permease [Thermodesulfobacteriota bacterium]
MADALAAALASTLEPSTLLSLAAGVLVGLIGGAIPGITITLTVILVLPFTFGMDTVQGIATMIGVYVGGESGGLVSACLLGMPGTPSAIATTFDGFPMARKGEPGRAVWLGIWAGFFGGLIAGVFLVFGTIWLGQLALKFGPWEYFSLFILTLSVVASLSEGSMLKGLISGAVGLLVTAVGTDPIMSVDRLTLGTEFLRTGLPFLPVLIGVYGVTQIVTDVQQLRADPAAGQAPTRVRLAASHLKVIREILTGWGNLLRSTLIGLWIGILPAVGGSAANILAYDQAKKWSKHPERFGQGHPEGIVASESANNANVAGSLVTIMAFGIPGDAVTAVMLGALIIHGIAPGPLFMTTHLDIAYGMFLAYFLATGTTVAIEAAILPVFLRLINVKRAYLFPVILVLCVIGAYALNNIMAHVWTLFFFGIIGFLMVRYGFPLAPIILGVILGDQIEVNLIRALMTSSDLTLFVTRPLSGAMLLLALASVGVAVYQARQARRRQAAARSGAGA